MKLKNKNKIYIFIRNKQKFQIKFNDILQVPVEIHEVEKFDEPKQKHIIDLIIDLGITKLVMGFSFMKPSLYVTYIFMLY